MHLTTMLFGHRPNAEAVFAALAIALILAWMCAEIAAALTRRLVSRADSTRRPDLPPSPWLRRTRRNLGGGGQVGRSDAERIAMRPSIRIVRVAMFVMLSGVFIPPVLELFGEPLRTGVRLKTLAHWALDGGLRVALIVVLAVVFTRLVAVGTARFEGSLESAGGADVIERAKRARTLSRLVRNVANVFVIAVAAIEILNELGISTAPILTGVGILGVGIGFGAQTLVKDMIGGFFLILENQVRLGDVAEINGTGGLVEAINLRTIVLRDVKGAVHVFPCGSITSLTNLTKDYSFAVVDVRVDYRYDTDVVIALLQDVAQSIVADPVLKSAVLAPLEVLGVDALGDSGVTIRARIKTVPQRQWEIGRELRRRFKKASEAKGIDLSASPQRYVVMSPAGPEVLSPPGPSA